MKKLLPDYVLVDFEQFSSMNIYRSNTELIVFRNHRNSLLNEHKLYSCVGRKRYDPSTSGYGDKFKIASASDNIIILFHYNENLKGCEPVAALRNKTFNTSQSIKMEDFEYLSVDFRQYSAEAFYRIKNARLNHRARISFPK